jgi:hypothetical protein
MLSRWIGLKKKEKVERDGTKERERNAKKGEEGKREGGGGEGVATGVGLVFGSTPPLY